MKATTVELKIKGMTCSHCATGIEKSLNKEGIVDKTVSYDDNLAQVTFDSEMITPEEITRIIENGDHYQVTELIEKPGANGSAKHLVIIGGGSAAFAAAIQAHELDAQVTIINDRLPIGGTCVNVGCVPSKTLIRAAEANYRATHHGFKGIDAQGTVKDFKAIIDQKRELVQELRQGKYIDVVADLPNVRIIEGRARLTAPNTIEVNGEELTADHILIATGVSPAIPEVPGLSDVGYLTKESAFELEELPKTMIVVGGRYVALESAQMFARLGSKVTILQRSDRILPTETADITDALTDYLTEEGIEVVTGTSLHRVYRENGEVVVEASVNGASQTFRATQILMATGRKPNTQNMGLEKAGVELDDKGYLKVNESLQTNVPGIYGAGDVIGEQQFVYTAAYEGKLAANNALNGEYRNRDYTALPWVVFTDPQVAGVGFDELQAETQGIDTDVAMLPLSYVPRALAARDTRGFIKLIRDRNSDKLIGARILAPEGSELLMEAAMAIKFGITVEDIVSMFHPYLTLSEGIKLAAITFKKDVSELSCCAT